MATDAHGRISSPIFAQQGVTLIEVLVGFVIFMSTLVVVLDYVSEQIYHVHQSDSNLQNLQFIYQLSTVAPYIDELASPVEIDAPPVIWSVSDNTLETYKQRNKTLALKKVEYLIEHNGNQFKWAVIANE